MSLESRIVALAQAIGLDIKAINTAIAGLGGGGGASIVQVIATLSYSLGGMSIVNVASASVTPASKIIVSLAGTDENEADDIDDWTVTATPLVGSIDFNIYCPGPFGGDVVVNYMIG